MQWQDFINQPIPSQLAKGKTQYWYDLFHDIAYQKFWDQTEAHRAADLALEAISANQFAKLGPFDTPDNPESYLRVVYTRAVIDAHHIIYGKCQPIKAIRDLGQHYIKLFRELCCRRKDPQSIAQQHATPQHPAPIILDMLHHIKQIDHHCGRQTGPISAPTNTQNDEADPTDFFHQQPSQDHTQTLDGAHYEAILSALTLLLDPTAYQTQRNALHALGQKLADQHQNLITQINLTNDERLILQSHFHYGKSITDIAKLHHMKYHDVRKHLKSGLDKARQVFNNANLGFEDFKMPD